MLVSQCKIAAVVLLIASVGAAGAGFLMHPAPAEESPKAKSPASTQQPAAKTKAIPAEGMRIGGQILDPDGKPVRGARLYLPALREKQLQSQAMSDADGRFHFDVMPEKVRLSHHLQQPWSFVHVVAVAEGYGPGIAVVNTPEDGAKLTVRLTKDDIVIRGRILDLQGKPVAGATVRVDGLGVPQKGDLSAFLDDLKGRTDGYPAENKFLTTVQHADFSRLIPSATTGEDGRFRIKGVGREQIAYLTIFGPTIATQEVRVFTRSGEKMQRLEWASSPGGGVLFYYGADLEHVAPPTKPITGVVRDKDTGKPLASIIIQSEKLAGNNIHGRSHIRTTTDKDGRYLLTGMPKGDGNLIRAVGPTGSAYMDVVHSIENTAGLEPVTEDIELRRGVLVKGRVLDQKTGAIVPSHVEYFSFEDNPHRKEFEGVAHEYYRETEPDGSFEMVVLPGHGLLVARAHNDSYRVGVGAEKLGRRDGLGLLTTRPGCMPTAYHRLTEIDPVKGAETLACDLILDPGRTLKGMVVDPDGKPLAGARICGLKSYAFTYWDHQPFPTAEFTAYGLSPDRPRNLLVIHEGRKLSGSLLARGDEKGPVTIKLQPWAVLTGRLVTPDGQPWTKGELRFMFGKTPDDVTAGSHPHDRIYPDKDGKFRFEGLIPGLKYSLAILEANAIKGYIVRDFTIESGQTKDLGNVQPKDN